MLLRPIGTLILNPQRADADDELSAAFATSPEKTSTIPALSMVPIETRPTFTARYKDAMTDNRRFGAKPDKKFVDRQAASPSSWKTPFMATWMASYGVSIVFVWCA